MTPPSKFACLAVSTVLALVGWFAVGVATQPDPGGSVRPCRTIEGLVLDGGSVSTTTPALLVVEPIPRRDIDDPAQTTTTVECGP